MKTTHGCLRCVKMLVERSNFRNFVCDISFFCSVYLLKYGFTSNISLNAVASLSLSLPLSLSLSLSTWCSWPTHKGLCVVIHQPTTKPTNRKNHFLSTHVYVRVTGTASAISVESDLGCTSRIYTLYDADVI